MNQTRRTETTRRTAVRTPSCLLAAAFLMLVVAGGCTALRAVGADRRPAGPRRHDPHAITAAELDELTRAFADRYVGLLSSTCDALKKDNPDPVQRREAQDLTLDAANNVYDIASNADSFTRMLDLVVVTTLVSQVWVDDDRAGDVFGDRGEVLVRSLHHGRVEALALAARVLRPDQLDVLDYTIWDWRRQNPDMVRMSSVRFSNFALDRGKSANADVLAAGGFFKNIGQTGQSVDEARLLTERMFYLLKRQPTLLRWQAEAAKDDLLATPEVGKALADVHRLTEQVEQLPRNIATERRASWRLWTSGRRPSTARSTACGPPSGTPRRWPIRSDKRAGRSTRCSKPATPCSRAGRCMGPLVHDSAAASPVRHPRVHPGAKEIAVAVGTVNDSLRSTNELLASPEWARRIQDVNRLADGRIRVASEQSQAVVNATFLRACVAVVVLSRCSCSTASHYSCSAVGSRPSTAAGRVPDPASPCRRRCPAWARAATGGSPCCCWLLPSCPSPMPWRAVPRTTAAAAAAERRYCCSEHRRPRRR